MAAPPAPFSVLWRLVWASLRPLSSPTILQGLCALVSTRWAHLLCHRACVYLSQFPGPALHCHRACVNLSLHLQGPAHCLLDLECSSLSYLGLPSAPQGSCALESFEYHASLIPTPPKPDLCMGLLWSSLGSQSLPSGRSHSPRAVDGLRSAIFSVFCPLSPCLAQLSEISQLPFGAPCEGASQCTRTLPAS